MRSAVDGTVFWLIERPWGNLPNPCVVFRNKERDFGKEIV